MILKAKPDDLSARFARAMAYFQLGEDRKALGDLARAIEKAPQLASARQYRAIVHARLGEKKEAQDDLAFLLKGDSTESFKLSVAAVVAAELGSLQDEAFAKLEAAMKVQPGDSGLAYDAACAYALASRAVAKTDHARSESQAGRAIRLLEAAIKNGYSDYDHIQGDSDLDAIRDVPAFVELVLGSRRDRRYSAVWSGDMRFDSAQSHGLDDPAADLRLSRDLIAQGYRPVSLSGARTVPDGPLLTASVWHRPSVTEQSKDDLAERQARAAIALARLGKAAEVWPLLVHSPDPRLRSFIINWLNPLGADPTIIAAEFDRLDKVRRGSPESVGRGSPESVGRGSPESVGRGSPESVGRGSPESVGRGSPDPAQRTDRRSPAPGETADAGRPSVAGRAATLRVPGDPRPTAILFHAGTSTRRALILSLGTYGSDLAWRA